MEMAHIPGHFREVVVDGYFIMLSPVLTVTGVTFVFYQEEGGDLRNNPIHSSIFGYGC
jgi:hypothetical protein